MMKHILVLGAHRLHITAFVRKKALKKKICFQVSERAVNLRCY